MIMEAPAERVWEIVAHRFADVGQWATAIPVSRPSSEPARDPGSPVAGRVCETGVSLFPEVEETIVDYDEAGRRLTYRGAGLPAFIAEARNRWSVVPVDDQRTSVRLDATVETRGLLGRLLTVPFRFWAARSGRMMLADLKHYAEHDTPSPRKHRQLAKRGNRAPSTVRK